MNLKPVRLALLSLSVTLALAACKPSGDAAPTAAGPEAAGAAATGAATPSTAEISGAGASFIYPLVSKWSADYNAATGAKVNYQSIGSGGGIAQIKAGTVDFGSSDKPLSSEELAQAGLGQFPSAIGGVVPVINVEGLQPGQLKLTGALLADIFLGKITMWNDPALVSANPGVALPAQKISLVHRSDGSGTTFNFTNYLSKVSPDWKSKVGEGTSVQWPGGVGGEASTCTCTSAVSQAWPSGASVRSARTRRRVSACSGPVGRRSGSPAPPSRSPSGRAASPSSRASW